MIIRRTRKPGMVTRTWKTLKTRTFRNESEKNEKI